MNAKTFWKLHDNLKPTQVYKLNKHEAFAISKINLLDQTAFGQVLPLKFINEPFVEIIRFETISLKNFRLKKLKEGIF